jgi:hypothetical protein
MPRDLLLVPSDRTCVIVNKEFERAKARDDQAWTDAALQSAQNLRGIIRQPYSVAMWSRATRQAFEDQWCPVPRQTMWDWTEIGSKYTPPKERVVALRSGDRLTALSAIVARRAWVRVHFLEGDPRDDCPMRGLRAIVMLDLAATYGQRLGCEEIHIEPVNDTLKSLYCGTFGFEEVLNKGRVDYLRRSLT